MLEAIFHTQLKKLVLENPINESDGETPRYYAFLGVCANITPKNSNGNLNSPVEIKVNIDKITYDQLLKFHTNYNFTSKVDLEK
jgi:hypothetical protein